MGPVLLNYYVTYRCNATCGFCDIWERPSPMVEVSDVRSNLAAARRLGVRIVDFTGGEPLLHPEIGAMLRHARGLGLRTSLTTNGLLYRKRAKALAGQVDLLHFSIDAADRETHDASRGVRCFEALLDALDLAAELGEHPDLLFTVTNENVEHLDRIYREISLPRRLVLIVNPLFEYNGLGAALDEAVMARVASYAKRPYAYLNPAFLSLRRNGGNDPDRPDCRAVSTTIVISPFNQLVLPCYHYGLDSLPIEGRLYELWRSAVVSEHRAKEGRHKACAGCTINCYFEPSFATRPLSPYFWQSLPSKIRYGWTKLVQQPLDQAGSRSGPVRPVAPRPAAVETA